MAPQTDRAELAARLKDMREYLDLSQEEVSAMVGIPRSAISLIEKGERKVDAVELKRFAEIYQCSIDQLTGPAKTDEASRDIAFLARAAAKLTAKDREELLRFAHFLGGRKEGQK